MRRFSFAPGVFPRSGDEVEQRASPQPARAYAELPLRAAVRAKVGWQNARGIRATIIRLAQGLAWPRFKEYLMNHSQRASIWVIAALFAVGAGAQTVVYPAKGQSPDQQKKDEGECHTWAVGQSKYDPANPPPPPATAKPATTATGTTPGAGARGAARVRWSARSSPMTQAPAQRSVPRRRGDKAAPEQRRGATAAAGHDAAIAGRHGELPEGACGVPGRARLHRQVARERLRVVAAPRRAIGRLQTVTRPPGGHDLAPVNSSRGGAAGLQQSPSSHLCGANRSLYMKNTFAILLLGFALIGAAAAKDPAVKDS